MKKKITKFLVAAAVALLPFTPAKAQVFIGGITVVGSTNAPMQSSYALVTNTAYSSLPPRTLVIGNVQTNSIVTVNYGYQWAGLGGTNLYLQNTFTTNFNQTGGLTIGQTIVIQLPSVQNSVPLQPWGTYQATNALGNVTNTVSLF